MFTGRGRASHGELLDDVRCSLVIYGHDRTVVVAGKTL